MKKEHFLIRASGSSGWMGGREYTRNLVQALLKVRECFRNDFLLSVIADSSDEMGSLEDFRSSLSCLEVSETIQEKWSLLNKIRWKVKRLCYGITNPRMSEALLKKNVTFVYPMVMGRSSQRLRSAAWIPDFQYKHFPEGAPSSEVLARRADAEFVARNAQTIVLSSRHAEKDCHELFPISVGRTRVLNFRVFTREDAFRCDPFAVLKKYNLPKKFFLVSNLLAPTKNHGVVLKSLAKLRDLDDLSVVFTGDLVDYRNPGFYNHFLSQIHELNVSSSTKVLGLIPKADQFQLLRSCLAYVQPSFFEGWHTGVEEARCVGKKIILSDIPVHREQNPPSAIYFDPNDPDECAKILRDAWSAEVGFDLRRESDARKSYGSLQLRYGQDMYCLASGVDCFSSNNLGQFGPFLSTTS